MRRFLKNKVFTQEDEAFLKENFPTYGVKYCSWKLGVPEDKIKTKVKRLGLYLQDRFFKNCDASKYIGLRFHKLLITEVLNNNQKQIVKCKCDCSKDFEINIKYLLQGKVKSCGCGHDTSGNYKHGQAAKDNPTRKYKMLSVAKRNAKRFHRELTITLDDIIIPEYCPLLGIKLDENSKNIDNVPSLDRIDNNKGYTKDNILVVSWRANRIKGKYSLQELKTIVNNLEKVLNNKDDNKKE